MAKTPAKKKVAPLPPLGWNRIYLAATLMVPLLERDGPSDGEPLQQQKLAKRSLALVDALIEMSQAPPDGPSLQPEPSPTSETPVVS